MFAAYAQAAGTGQELFFVFGDSYADTGNLPRTGPFSGADWLYPYGITYPGYPDGRFCDGKLQTDWLAELLGIPTPPPYLNLTDQSTAHGVNFATAGSGVTFAYGENPLGGQVDNLELFLRTDPYSKEALANSVTLVSVNGNDYTAFNGNTSNASTVEVMYIESVVTGIAYNVQRLYDFGLRDVMVSNLLPASCIPVYTQQYNYSKCDTAVDSLIQLHNQQLLDAVKEINSQNPGARFIILDAFAAFSQLFEQANAVGMYKNMLVFTVPPHRGAKVCLDSVANCSRFMSGLCEKVV
jgi:phospholipase/lecithinase/hemolysin